MAFIPYVWDVNDTNTAPLPASLLNDGYATAAIPTSAEFNELWRNVSGLVSAVNSLFRPGTIIPSFNTAPMAGWIQLQDGSIGSATSGATLLADPTAEALYTVIYNSIADAEAPVAGGRVGGAAADFAANKHITFPATNGRVFANAQGFYNNGSVFGETTHIMTEGEIASHSHAPPAGTTGFFLQPYGVSEFSVAGGTIGAAGLSVHTAPTGNNDPFNIVQPTTAAFYFIKL